MNDSIAMVIPILNEAKTLPALLTGIESQTVLPQEIIFVDAGSTDSSVDSIHAWWQEKKWANAQCQVLSLPGGMPGGGRNAGIRAAQSEWIAFIDGGITPEKDWLEQLTHFVQTHDTQAVFGVCEFSAERTFEKAVCALSYGYGAVHPVIPASLFHRQIFERVGFFREDLRVAEDILWVKQFEMIFGQRSVCWQAKVHYTHFPSNPSELFKKWYLVQHKAILAGTFRRQKFFYPLAFMFLLGSFFWQPFFAIGLLVLYFVLRGLCDPWRRSGRKMWWGRDWLSALACFPVAFLIDCAKLGGIVVGSLQSLIK